MSSRVGIWRLNATDTADFIVVDEHGSRIICCNPDDRGDRGAGQLERLAERECCRVGWTRESVKARRPDPRRSGKRRQVCVPVSRSWIIPADGTSRAWRTSKTYALPAPGLIGRKYYSSRCDLHIRPSSCHLSHCIARRSDRIRARRDHHKGKQSGEATKIVRDTWIRDRH
jgi:hypothetical protein